MFLYVRILPFAMALATIVFALRQRSSLTSPLIGVAALLAFAFTMDYQVIPSTLMGKTTELQITS